MSRIGRPRLPNFMTGPPGSTLQQLGVPWGEWTPTELLTAMAYRDAAVLERETWDDVPLEVDGIWSRTACTRAGNFYVGKAAFLVGVNNDPNRYGVLRSLLEPIRLSEQTAGFGRPAGE